MCNPQTYLSSNNMLTKLQKHFDWRLLSQRKGTENVHWAAKLLEIIRIKKLIPNAVL